LAHNTSLGSLGTQLREADWASLCVCRLYVRRYPFTPVYTLILYTQTHTDITCVDKNVTECVEHGFFFGRTAVPHVAKRLSRQRTETAVPNVAKRLSREKIEKRPSRHSFPSRRPAPVHTRAPRVFRTRRCPRSQTPNDASTNTVFSPIRGPLTRPGPRSASPSTSTTRHLDAAPAAAQTCRSALPSATGVWATSCSKNRSFDFTHAASWKMMSFTCFGRRPANSHALTVAQGFPRPAARSGGQAVGREWVGRVGEMGGTKGAAAWTGAVWSCLVWTGEVWTGWGLVWSGQLLAAGAGRNGGWRGRRPMT
jgi:hypothetical protein